MNLSLITGTEPERRLLPGGTHRGPTPYVIAIMTFAMMIVAAAGLALANAAGIVAGAVEHRYVLQLPDGSGGKLEAAVKAARSVRGITGAEAVPEAEMRRLLEKWVGPGGLGQDLPVPAIIHLDLSPDINAAQVGALLARAVPGSRFIGEEATLAPLLGSLRALRWLAVVLVLLMAAATSAAVVLAARGRSIRIGRRSRSCTESGQRTTRSPCCFSARSRSTPPLERSSAERLPRSPCCL